MAHLGLETQRVGDLERVYERPLLGLVGRVVRLVAAREVGPDAGDLDRARLLCVGGRLDERGPLSLGGAAPTETGVALEVDPGTHADGPAGSGDRRELIDGVRRDVHTTLDHGRVVLAGDREPREQRPGVARVAQRERLLQNRDTEPVGTPSAGGSGGLDKAVSVAVGLYDRHHLCVGDARLEGGDVVPDRVEVDDDLRPRFEGRQRRHRSSTPTPASSARQTSGIAPATAAAVTGPSWPASAAAAPCTQEPPEPASNGSKPAATRAPQRPARTSPAPAVASHGVPVVETRTLPVGVATNVWRPLSSTTASYRSAASRANRSCSDSTRSRSTPSMRASSPACGVSSVGTPSGPVTCCSPSASTTTGTASSSESRSACSASAPPPEPITQACTRPEPTTTSGCCSRTRSAAPPW